MIGELISAGANLIGGLLGQNKADKDREAAAALAARQEAVQYDFAKNSLSWKVQDAKNAGIHPLYALGGSTPTYSPVSVAGGGGSPLAEGIAHAGQDLGRAAQSAMTSKDRDDTVAKQAQALALSKAGLENELLATQIAKLRSQIGPPMPALNQKTLIDGQPATAIATPSGAVVTPDKIEQKADTAPAAFRIRPGGVRLYANPWFSDGQDLEDRYGEHGGSLLGVANLPADVAYTAYRMWPRNDSGGLWVPDVAGYFKRHSRIYKQLYGRR